MYALTQKYIEIPLTPTRTLLVSFPTRNIHNITRYTLLLFAANNSSSAVMTLGAMVKKDPCSLLGQLPRLVETVVKSLDPHTPALRDACLKAATAVLHVMVKVM